MKTKLKIRRFNLYIKLQKLVTANLELVQTNFYMFLQKLNRVIVSTNLYILRQKLVCTILRIRQTKLKCSQYKLVQTTVSTKSYYNQIFSIGGVNV